MHEVQKYIMLSEHGYVGYAVIVNKKFWEGLPAEIRAQLEKAMKEATEYTNSIAQKENDDAMEAMKKSGLTQILPLTAEQKQAWRVALKPVYAEMAARVGQATIDEFEKEANAATH
jgi:C4-dicarboxylate-binding protein DctP